MLLAQLRRRLPLVEERRGCERGVEVTLVDVEVLDGESAAPKAQSAGSQPALIPLGEGPFPALDQRRDRDDVG